MDGETEKRTPGRKRDESTRCAILRAAFDMIAESGYRALTMEGVASRSGAGKTTVYRWWPTKAALASDAFVAGLTESSALPADASALECLRFAMHQCAVDLSGQTGKVLACIVGGGRDDPQTMQMFKEKIAQPRKELGRALLRRAVEAGELRADLDIDAALEALFMPIYLRVILGQAPVEPDWVDRLADTVLRGLLAEGSASRSAEDRAGASLVSSAL